MPFPSQAAAATDPPFPGIDRRRGTRGAWAWRQVLRRGTLGLLLLAALALTAGWSFHHLEQNRLALDAAAGRATAQRMLVSRIAALSAETPPNLAGIAAATIRLSATLDQAPANPDDRPLRDFLAAAETLGDPAPLHALALGPLSQVLDDAVAETAATAAAAQARMARQHALLIAGMLVAFLLVLLVVMRPLARHVAALAARLDREARRDPLTGLLSRRAISADLARRMAAGEPVAVMIVDLDWFKEANEAEGHAGGDALLQAAAARIRTTVRQDDAVGRVGGDEFVAVLSGVRDHTDAETIAQRLCEALHRPVPFAGRPLRMGATLGIALSPGDAATPELLLRAADDALLRAKRAGRGGYSRATPADTARIERDASILRAMGSCTGDLPGLDAHLQPIVSLADPGRVLCFEALARWTARGLGAISPGEFLPVAQRIGQLPWLGGQVRRAALAAFARLRAEGLPAPLLAFNLSAAEIMRGDVVEAIVRDVEAAGLSLACIEIEITEEILLERVSTRTIDQLAALRGRGARLALDDFGTGNSGLAQLLRLPLDKVKLDRTFIRGLGHDHRAEEVVRATMSLAGSLGIEVVAEGVETEAQAVALRALGCNAAQGFLYARPMPLAALQTWLRARGAPSVVPLRAIQRAI